MPHAPVLVGAASCADVVLRWRSIESDAEWPIHGYVVQRFPDAQHTLTWETLVESSNASESTDTNVRSSHQYLYRVQAISGAARSPFAYHVVSMNQTSCAAHKSLLAYLPSAFQVVPFLDMLSIEAVQTFVLIVSCFLAVFGVMRSNVKRVQHTRSRQGRLRKMEKSTQEETTALKLYSLPRLSSSDVSTEPSVSTQDFCSRSSMFECSTSSGLGHPGTPTTVATTVTRRSSLHRSESMPRAASFSASLDTSNCHYCHKKFGIFRRRRVCDVCEVITLCRKCGAHAPADMSVDGLRESLGGGSPMQLATLSDGARPRATKSRSARARRPKIICRDCCDHAQRFSTAR
jgi:hypothetical protein